MFDDVWRQLRTWASAQGAGEVRFSHEAVQPGADPSVTFSLLGVLPMPPPRTLHRAPLRFRLRYLVTCTAEDTLAAHGLLGRLLVAAMQESAFQVELGDVSPEWWVALGWPPQPAFQVLWPVTVPLPEPSVPLAREHVLSVQPSGRAWRRGTVTDAQGRPVAGARVQVEGAVAPLYTDSAGQFEVTVRPEDALDVTARTGEVVRAVQVRPPAAPGAWVVPLPPES